ncbi:MAG: DUF4962 domain-containing protein [Isosphaeraceae bacterium]
MGSVARPSIAAFLAVLSLGAAAPAQGPVVPNRQAKADEWGYHPADGESVRLNPPSWTWIHEPEARTYTVQWSADPGFREPRTVEGIPWPTYTHNSPLEPGTYSWRYRFRDAKGRESNWSVARRVVVPAEAVAFPMPTRAEQRERVPAEHPRLFLRPEDLPGIRRAAAEGPAANAFAELRKRADALLKAEPTPEPTHRGSARDKDDAEAVKYWWPNRTQTERACEEAELLAFVALVTGEAKYGEAARRWVLHLASWDPDGPTNFALNCEAAKPLLYRLPRAYDWAYAYLNEADREAVRKVMARRIADAWKSGEVQNGVGHLNRPYNSHGNRVWHKIGEAAIAFLGEVPEAETWLDYAVNKFYACYPVWSDDDGGWHEGASYLVGYMTKAVWWLQVSRSALKIDGLKKPFFAQVGDFPLYVAPPGSPNAGFGDLSFRPPSGGWGEFLDFFIRTSGSPHAGNWRWWSEGWKMRGPGGVIGFLARVNLPELPTARPPDDLPSSKVFRGIGVASLHTSLLGGADDVHLLMKASPFGSQSHGHNPQNTYQINAFGDALLTSCGYRDLHGSRFHYQYVHSTKAQTGGVLFDGQGQKMHVAGPQGRIVAERFGPDYDHVVGDATAAYDGRLDRFLRHAVLVKDSRLPAPVIVLFDELRAPHAGNFGFLLHALAPFELDEAAGRLSVAQPHATATIQYLSPVPLAFRQWDGFDPPPTQEFPNQWHVEATSKEPRAELDLLTVIVPARKAEPIAWRAERIDEADSTGVRITLDGSTLVATFGKGVGGQPAPLRQVRVLKPDRP